MTLYAQDLNTSGVDLAHANVNCQRDIFTYMNANPFAGVIDVNAFSAWKTWNIPLHLGP